MHCCRAIHELAAPAATRSLARYDDQQPMACNDVQPVDTADLAGVIRNCTEGIVRVDGSSPVDEHAQAEMLRSRPCTDNLQAQGRMRLFLDAAVDEIMQPCCTYAHTHLSAKAQASCNDGYAHGQAASLREHPRVHDTRMQSYDQYPHVAQEEGYVRVQGCLPPMSSTLIECIARAGARAARSASMWRTMQLMSTVSQMIGVLLVLALCSNEEVMISRSLQYRMSSSPLPAWALGYALGCLASLPLFCVQHSHSSRGSDALADVDAESSSRVAEGSDGEGVLERRLGRCVDLFFGIWFVLGVVWVFGRPSCAQASPHLYSLCVTLLMLNGLRYMMPLLLCCALCCCLQPTTSRLSHDFDGGCGGGKKGATQENIDATLPIFKFKHRRSMLINNLHNDIFSSTTTTAAEKNSCMDDMEYCCICLKRYKEATKLRGLPCSHYFHVDCVDKWLKINARCPLCKFSIKGSKIHSSFLL